MVQLRPMIRTGSLPGMGGSGLLLIGISGSTLLHTSLLLAVLVAPWGVGLIPE